jgi:1-acyl-sn-glycerol-3-phosphate acyltransferase
MRTIGAFLLLLFWKVVGTLFYRSEVGWVGGRPEDPWKDLRILAILNHTSLLEPLYLAVVPVRVLWRLANHAVVPIASKTLERRGAGLAFRFAGRRVISVSRKRDLSWQEVLRHCCGPKSITVIFPEGRMLRRTGLDANGKPMTIRSGVADLIAEVSAGRILLVYSGGLHHVAAPGEKIPRLFKRLALRLEPVDIETYREQLGGTADMDTFRRRVVADLTKRRNTHCPLIGPTTPKWAA